MMTTRSTTLPRADRAAAFFAVVGRPGAATLLRLGRLSAMAQPHCVQTLIRESGAPALTCRRTCARKSFMLRRATLPARFERVRSGPRTACAHCDMRNRRSLCDLQLARALRVLFEDQLLALQVLRGRLNPTRHVRGARDQHVVARRRAVPGVVVELPSELVLR